MKSKKGPISRAKLVLLLCALDATWAAGPQFYSNSVQWMGFNSQIFEVNRDQSLKTYYLKTDAPLRDDFPKSREVKIEEGAHRPIIRTGSTLFDGLFALALQEMEQLSVTRIEDYSFDPAPCECFETGEKWKYVWTRDIAYAAHLGLAAVDPQRTANSLRFKLSHFRQGMGEGEQVVQDTGSGGSWPVSTDRVIWALGAYETLLHMPQGSDQYRQFLNQSYSALKNSLMTDRFAIYDQTDGLYRGEQSFLDWREQTYPEWMRNNVVHIGMSKTLSANMAQYIALTRAAQFAKWLDQTQDAEKFQVWATKLKAAIISNFWDGTSLSAMKSTFLNQRPLQYYDLLGISLAITEGVATQAQAQSALSSYPQSQVGPPVTWPQRQDLPIYHNRAIWPFVTAYALKAAKKIDSAHHITSYVRSLLLGPAQNLSNMENYEFLTMKNWFNDGTLSGPVVNSRRQLWSVAGHISMVLDVIFGKQVRPGAIRFNPTITSALRTEIFGNSKLLKLQNLWFHNHKINLAVQLPNHGPLQLQEGEDGLYVVGSVKLNGQLMDSSAWLETSQLQTLAENELVITMVAPQQITSVKTMMTPKPRDPHHLTMLENESLYMPKTPVLAPIGLSDDFPLLSFHSDNHEQISYQIFKNGKLIATTKNTHYLDRDQPLDKTACYAVQAKFDRSSHESFPSEPFCYWPSGSIQHYPIGGPHLRTSGSNSAMGSAAGRVYLKDWGNPDQKILLENFTPTRSGQFAIQVDYNNIDRVSTGITCAVKKVTVLDQASGEVIKRGVLFMPHHGQDRFWTDSNFVPVRLIAKRAYTVTVEDFQNMSYFSHFESYSGRGGKYGAFNRMNFAEIKVLHLGPAE